MEANYAVKPGLATIMVPLLTLIQGGPAEAAARKKTRTDGERPEDVLLTPPVAHHVAFHLLPSVFTPGCQAGERRYNKDGSIGLAITNSAVDLPFTLRWSGTALRP